MAGPKAGAKGFQFFGVDVDLTEEGLGEKPRTTVSTLHASHRLAAVLHFRCYYSLLLSRWCLVRADSFRMIV